MASCRNWTIKKLQLFGFTFALDAALGLTTYITISRNSATFLHSSVSGSSFVSIQRPHEQTLNYWLKFDKPFWAQHTHIRLKFNNSLKMAMNTTLQTIQIWCWFKSEVSSLVHTQENDSSQKVTLRRSRKPPEVTTNTQQTSKERTQSFTTSTAERIMHNL